MPRILKFGRRALSEASSMILRGGVVAYPTDTVYGLGCDPFNFEGIEKVVRAKKRKKGELPVLVDSIGRAAEFGRLDSVAFRLAAAFWPGPLTIVTRSRITLPGRITGGTGKVGLRIPKHRAAVEFVRSCGGALVSTSANKSGNPPLRDATSVARELRDDVDLVLDDGSLSSGIESSVVSIDNGLLTVLREKSISKEMIQHALRLPKGRQIGATLRHTT